MNEARLDPRSTSFDAEFGGRRWPHRLRHLRIVIAVALLACNWPQHGALAKVFPAVGDNGDVQEKQPDLCPAGNFLIGLNVRVGDWMDQLAIICGHLDSSGNVTGLYYGTPRGGTGGAAPVPMTCGGNEIMTGVAFTFTPNNAQVRRLTFHCASMQAVGVQADAVIGNTTFPAGPPPNPPRQDCPAGEAINGLLVNYGAAVNAVGISCTSIPQLAPPPPAATLLPGQTAQGPVGGAGGGQFQTMCNTGDQVVGFDTVVKNGVIIKIAPVCGNRQASPTDTNGKPSVGTDTGGIQHNPRCEPSAVVTQLQVFVANIPNIPLVGAVGFTCWNWQTNKPTNSLANYGTTGGRTQHLVCPLGQIAVGIFGHAGTAIDQLGLVCGAWTAAPPAPSAVCSLIAPGAGGAIVLFDTQNNFRTSCNVHKLCWASWLANAAQRWVNGCNQYGGFACHENDPKCPNNHASDNLPGENFYFGPGDPNDAGKAAAAAAGFWWGERKNYSVSNPVFKGGNCKSGETCIVNGHFTQLVWSGTREIGCASNTCTIGGQTSTLWSCKYFPAGNFNVDTSLPGVTTAIAQQNLRANVSATCPGEGP